MSKSFRCRCLAASPSGALGDILKAYVARSTAVAAAILLTLGLASCAEEASGGEVQAPASPAESQPEVSANEEVPEEEFVEEELEGELVASFPKEVPLYDGQITSSLSKLSEAYQEPQWNVRMTTDDSFETVDAAIREAFGSNGWSISTEMESGGGLLLIANGGGPTTTITYTDIYGDGITINYGVG